MSQAALLTPVFVLVLWTFIIFLIMACGRVKHIKDLQEFDVQKKTSIGLLPAWVERTADNYNHLFEQPVAFYAITICIALINDFNPLMIQLAWAFVIIRIIHSMVQLTFNLIFLRFGLFAAGWLIIAYMAYSQLLA